MARPRKTVSYTADKATVKRFFRQSMEARGEQKAVSGLITDLNSTMEAAGVHPGVMTFMRRIAGLPEGKRGYNRYLTLLYLEWLEEELEDVTFKAPEAEEARAVPFASARTVSAA